MCIIASHPALTLLMMDPGGGLSSRLAHRNLRAARFIFSRSCGGQGKIWPMYIIREKSFTFMNWTRWYKLKHRPTFVRRRPWKCKKAATHVRDIVSATESEKGIPSSVPPEKGIARTPPGSSQSTSHVVLRRHPPRPRSLDFVWLSRLDVHLQKSSRTFSLMVKSVSTSVKIATSSTKTRIVTDLPKNEMPFNFFDKRSNNRSRSKRRGGWREGNPSVRKTSTAPIRLSRSRLEWTFWRHHKEL